MLHAVLCLPPELWLDSELDKIQRYARYLEASRRIEDCEREIARLRNLLKSIMAYACDIEQASDTELTRCAPIPAVHGGKG
jgi:wobble nucleotide-excising tRNase